MMPRKLFLTISLILVCGQHLFGQTAKSGVGDVTIHLNGGADVAYIGDTNIVEIWIKNDVALDGMIIPFEFSIGRNYQFDPNHGTFGYADPQGDAVGKFDAAHNDSARVDNISPDTVAIYGIAFNTPLPAHATDSLCYTLAVYILPGQTSLAGGFCVDNIFWPLTMTWEFSERPTHYSYPPDFQGNTNAAPNNPTAPPVCFDIVYPPDHVHLTPTQDTFIDEINPGTVNGSKIQLIVRRGGTGYELDALLQFDLSSIPAGAAVDSARLQLYYYWWNDADPGGRTLNLHHITGFWNEATTTWSNRPSYDATVASTGTVPSQLNNWMVCDLTSEVQSIVNGTASNDGWEIRDPSTGSFAMIYFYAKENGSNVPTLDIYLHSCGPEDYYWKPPYVDYAPHSPGGMPDFDQKQRPEWIIDIPMGPLYTYDGPTALLNCFWWFDSKYESSPVDPRPFYPAPASPPPNDHYPLIYPYGNGDDHDTSNVIPHINALAVCMNTNIGKWGSLPADVQSCITLWLTSRGLEDEYAETTYFNPTFDFVANEVKRSQDVILLLGFYMAAYTPSYHCERVGGHYVTVAGVCTECKQIVISDPYIDTSSGLPMSHNDAANVSHDAYLAANTPTLLCPNIPANWYLPGYPADAVWKRFYECNGGSTGLPSLTNPVYAMVEQAIVICPAESCDCTPGDANGDATIDISDAVYLIAYIFAQGPPPTPYALCSGDANCDCAVDISDAVYLIAYIFAGGPAPCSCDQWLINCGPPLR